MSRRVAAVVLAAGESRRMGEPKQLLVWGDTTVLGQTLRNVRQSKVSHILVVTGYEAAAVAAEAAGHGVELVHNPEYASGEMLSSLQTAIPHLPSECDAMIVVLGDQPMIEPPTLDRILEAYEQGQGELIVPAYQGQRGNPVLIGRPYFAELLALPQGEAPRTLLRRHVNDVHLIDVDSDTILHDIDRPEDYERYRPKEH